MHPAFSIIFFTTAAGAGYGLLGLVGILAPLNVLPDGGWFGIVALAVGVLLVVVGLLSSVLHLGHPERAWRAVSQWRSSWLAREGIASILTFAPIALLGIAWGLLGSTGPVTWVGGVATALGCIATVYCTAMIYRSLKPIHQWHNAWVVPNYLALALMTGAVLLNALLHLFGDGNAAIGAATMALIGLSVLVKEGYWGFISRVPAKSSPETATGLGRIGKVRFLEAPHTEANYLLKEMGFKVGRKHSARLRMISRVLGFGLPLVATLLAIFVPAVAAPATVIAVAGTAVGIIVERWLFFAEARHAVQLYYGAQTV